jgi:cytoskeletal protein CcmA (bactofilin family)
MSTEGTGIEGGAERGTRDLVIGEGVRIVGDIKAPAGVRLFGTVEGDLTAGEVLIGQSGSVVGSLKARTADIYGAVAKEAEVTESVTLRSTARLEGELRYRSIQIEAGAKLNCSMKVMEEQPKGFQRDTRSSGSTPQVQSPSGATPAGAPAGTAEKDA